MGASSNISEGYVKCFSVSDSVDHPSTPLVRVYIVSLFVRPISVSFYIKKIKDWKLILGYKKLNHRRNTSSMWDFSVYILRTVPFQLLLVFFFFFLNLISVQRLWRDVCKRASLLCSGKCMRISVLVRKALTHYQILVTRTMLEATQDLEGI